MSKMSQLHAELSEQAYDLGYASLEAAEANGCEVDWENQKLIPPEEAAHKAWLAERDDILDDLMHLAKIYENVKPDEDIIKRTMKFIEEQCND